MTLRDELMDGWMNGAGKRTNEEEQEWKKRCTCLCDRMGELKASTHQGSSLQNTKDNKNQQTPPKIRDPVAND
jgi:hypothetical protein